MESDREVAGELVVDLTAVSATFGCPSSNVGLSDAPKAETESFVIQKGVTLPKLWHERLDVHTHWVHERPIGRNVRLPPIADIAARFRFRPVADIGLRLQTARMRNIQIIDRAENATFSLFQATAEEFEVIFPDGRDIEVVEDLIERVGEGAAGAVLSLIWQRPILKRDAQGIHGTLYYEWNDRRAYLPSTKREVDWQESALNEAQRRLYRSHR